MRAYFTSVISIKRRIPQKSYLVLTLPSSGFADFFSEGALGSTLATHSSRISSGGITRVRTITFEQACVTYGVPAFAKIDIEGAEVAVLAAATEFLKSHPINFTLDTNHLVAGKLSNRR